MAISFFPSHPTLALGPFQSWVSSWYEVTPQLHKLTFQTLHLLQLHNFYVQSSREATAKRQYMSSFMHVSPVYFHNKHIHDFYYSNQAGWSQSEFVSDKVYRPFSDIEHWGRRATRLVPIHCSECYHYKMLNPLITKTPIWLPNSFKHCLSNSLRPSDPYMHQ